jgi:hypothetical protein
VETGICALILSGMHSAQDITAYHEAGHARAAVRRRAPVSRIDITTDDEDGRYLGNTEADVNDPDRAFYAYAGPWVSARLIDGPGVGIDRVLYYMRASTADWPMFQRAMGRTVTDRDIAEAEYVWTFGGDPPAGEVRPQSTTAQQWHDELADEWTNIEALARALLAKQEVITVGDGPPLVRDEQSSVWRKRD